MEFNSGFEGLINTVGCFEKHEDSKFVKIDFFFTVGFYGMPVW